MPDPVGSFNPGHFGHACRGDWPIDFSVAFLNHGSFGSVPHAIHAEAEEWRRRYESHPIEWYGRRTPEEVRKAATCVADFIGSSPERTGFVTNATAAVNGILRDIRLESGDEVIVLSHGYGAVKQTVRHLVSMHGAKMVEAEIKLPVSGEQSIVAAVEQAITPRTRLAVIDQITSPTALVIPIDPIVKLCSAHDIPVLVDGAHAPGMLERPADLSGAAWWTGNLHKWVCAPKGCAILTASADRVQDTHPPIISHGYLDSFSTEFDWQGTRDFAPWLTAPAAIRFWDRYGGMATVRARNHDLVCKAHSMLVEQWGVEPISPLDGSLLGSMATVRLPRSIHDHFGDQPFLDLIQRLFDEFKVEVPVMEIDEQWFIRISAQVYNELEDYHRLADAIDVLAKESS